MRLFLSALLLLAFFPRTDGAEDWKIIQTDGRAYVSFANVAQFYRFPRFRQISRTVSLGDQRRGLRAQAGTSEFFLNGVRFFCDYPLVVKGDDNLISAVDVSKIVEPVLRPNKIGGAQPVETVVLDPGHGGEDSGTAGPSGNEEAYALEVARRAREELWREGFKVEMTREGDESVPLEQRVRFANQFSNAVFISIHFNSAANGSGVETYALAPAGVPSNVSTEAHPASVDTDAYPGNAQDPQNIALAAAVHGAILARVSVFDRGVRHARFQVLRDIRIPAVLVEAGFLNDPAEGARIATPHYRQLLGQAIAQAVATYHRATNFRSSDSTVIVAARNLPPHTRSITESLGATSPTPTQPAQRPSAAIQVPD